MRVSATEFKMNMGKYIERAAFEDIIITRNGKDVALLTNVEAKKKDALKSLRGILKGVDVTRQEIREERLARYNEDPN
ncbi:MAG: type II toxin-antitoxin system Phd/YefM family antitoxin [Firmicutes bacterium]|nr:type II toxin-antitoxin system Phd/YefM family antitoxin [Bacillota bacterium]MCL5039202.1 type II toxin-antitoxin system Phd/YefM family antitoxin [Bacillota bacterium]